MSFMQTVCVTSPVTNWAEIIFTHELPKVNRQIRSYLLKKFPEYAYFGIIPSGHRHPVIPCCSSYFIEQVISMPVPSLHRPTSLAHCWRPPPAHPSAVKVLGSLLFLHLHCNIKQHHMVYFKRLYIPILREFSALSCSDQYWPYNLCLLILLQFVGNFLAFLGLQNCMFVRVKGHVIMVLSLHRHRSISPLGQRSMTSLNIWNRMSTSTFGASLQKQYPVKCLKLACYRRWFKRRSCLDCILQM